MYYQYFKKGDKLERLKFIEEYDWQFHATYKHSSATGLVKKINLSSLDNQYQ